MSKGLGQKITVKFTEDIVNNEAMISLPDFPGISGYTTQTSYGSSSTINSPEEANPGDLLLLFWAKDDDPIESVADGWTRIWTSYDTYHRVSVHYKFYEGEDKQFTLTHDSEETSAIVVSIPKADVPVVSSAYRGTTSTPTPPSLTSGFDENTPTLWFAFAGCDYRDVTGFPSNFPDNNIASNRSGVGLGIASLASNNASEAPNNFTLSASDQTSAGTLAIKFKTKSEILKDELKVGWKVTGQEYKYINGPLIDKEYQIFGVENHPTVEKALLLTMHPLSRFPTVEGNLTVEYDASVGSLAGRGGAVESFIEIFTPTDLIPEPNPGIEETVTVAPASLEVMMTEIQYIGRFAEETITVAPATLEVELIHTSIVNP